MIEQAISWCIGILVILGISYTICFNVVFVLSTWKCRKKKYTQIISACHERDCKFSGYCGKYEHICTAEEIDGLKKIIDKMQG